MDSIKTLLKKDRIDAALDLWLAGKPAPQLEAELIQLSARLANLVRDERAGVVSAESLILERNRIRQALFDLISAADAPAAVETPPQTPFKTVAFLEANPLPDRNLLSNVEIREISALLDRYPDRFSLRSAFAITLGGLAAAIDRFRPHLLHISLYSTADFLILHDPADREARIPNADVLLHFDLPAHRPEAIFFNTWISTDLAKDLSRRGSVVIGANSIISSEAAIEFATGFYTALGYGKDYLVAYDLGRSVLARGRYVSEKDKIFAYAQGEPVRND
jgi:hypothetical protein